MTDTRDYESEAAEQGWKPKDEYNGPEGKWTDAKTFVEKGEKIAGIMKSRLEKLDLKVQQLQKSNKEFGEYQKTLLDKAKQENENLIKELKVKRATAIEESDGQAYNKYNDEIERAQKELHKESPSGIDDNGIDELAQEWLADNSWYKENKKLRIYTEGLYEEVLNEGYRGKAYYNELTRRVEEAFPEEFKNPKKRGSNTVESGGPSDTNNQQAHTYENLPKDAQAACDRYVKNGLTTKEDYVKNYDWD
jgi:hypothetical protein